MGNSLGARKKTTKIMKMNGETIKLKTPVNAGDVMKSHPGLVLLDSEMVKHYGVRAKPLEPQQDLKAKRLYFLVELPKFPEDKSARRVRSGINMSAKDRLESLMLGRRSASDLSFMKAPSIMVENGGGGGGGGVEPLRVKLRLPKAEVERLMRESKDGGEAAEKIMRLCMEKNGGGGGGGGGGEEPTDKRRVQWKEDASKGRGKRVGFLPVSQELNVE
ncbi:uncharacterized protein At1g66480 [Lactuca sativa]|uniref:Plastid movement impaired 2 n=1 Tax=Lactuca sativa TaxID=4236 RepID=A0A9R1US67_LACSA|nr:uncharacterized protein At1g66480 [Lactuca sativa]KAJ0192147.1 hypothetical protein LSAT_V11C800406160 [Lactuca sativa]